MLAVPAAALATVLVFLVHFRPWQGGLLEDWGLALAWDAEGVGGFAARLPATLGRPFHLLPHYLGMAISDGGFVGPYLILGLVAILQLAAALWAVRAVVPDRTLRWALALAVALHPWWAAGDILRFLPAQVSVLGLVVWLGGALRYGTTGRRRWLAPMMVAPAVGLLTYQALAASLVIASVCVALTAARAWPRRLVIVALAVTVSAAVLAWSVVAVPRLYPDSYESQLAVDRIDLLESFRLVLRTLALHAPAVVAWVVGVAVVVIALGFHQRLTPLRAWTLLALIAASPTAAFAYASQSLHLNDPERIAMPIGMVLWTILCCSLNGVRSDRGTQRGVASALIALTAVGAVLGYSTWTGYAVSQQRLLSAVETVREDLPPDAVMIVADNSGRFGDIYLLLPPHLNMALDEEFGDGADAVLCTPAGVERRHPVAALYPIVTTPDCDAVPGMIDSIRLASVPVRGGTIDIFEVLDD